MNPWLDGLTVLTSEWRLTLPILLGAFASQALIVLFLESFFGDRLAASERLALAVGGWTLPLLLLSLLWYFTGWNGLFWILPAALILLLLFRLRTDLKPAVRLPSLFLVLFLFLSLPLRLAYASRTALPLYFDSAQHYLVIKTILLENPSILWNWLSASYYHFGFHFLAAFIAAGTGAEIARVMLILGQVILLLIPFSVFFIVRHETNSEAAGGFALLLAAFGWYMPAHAVNWGKYPALMSAGMLAWLWGMTLIVFRQRSAFSRAKRRTLYLVLAVCAALTVLTHSRSLIVLGIVILASAMSAWLEQCSRRWMHAALFVTAAVVIWLGWLASRQSLLTLLFDPYLVKGISITALVLLLFAFAWMAFPRFTFVCLTSIALLLGSLFLPPTILSVGRGWTLLDRPFVEMILFLPLSVLGGLGLAGLEKRLHGRFLWRAAIILLAAGWVVVRAVFGYDLYPSDCCVIVGNDDVTAMDWMAKQLPPEAHIGIASTQLNVLPNEILEGDVGADAGVWITPLTGRAATLIPFNVDFSQPAALDSLCRAGISHLFIGERGQTFDRSLLDLRPEWYRPLLSMPETTVYEVAGCDK
ncbi:MAG: hypothetical protein ACOYYF_11955 [Chloroflexota bacterium]|nr:hypothetical protein [Chloroflexota bacterium]MBI5702324.1 hypothetical protein [Chloroflexota bacterium]